MILNLMLFVLPGLEKT